MEVPQTSDLLKDFADRHHMQVGEQIDREVLPIRTCSLANVLITSGYSSLGEEIFADTAVGLLLNMLHRNFSLVDGAILAFATECGQMAEVTARASVESSVNIAYIVLDNPPDRMRAYFDYYFTAVDKQVSTWRAGLDGLSGAEADIHHKAVARRKESNAVLRYAIEGSMIPATGSWPRTIEQRFKALGDPLAYRTIYSRMSAEVHADAEETLRYLIGKLGNEELFQAMALETVWTTRMYVHYAVSWFLRASIMYALRYGMNDAANFLKQEYAVIDSELAEISKHIGAGL